MLFSINGTAALFNVSKGTVLAWRRRGLPGIAPTGPGKPARLHFKEVLAWRKAAMARRGWATEETIAEMEAAVRTRLRALKTRRPS